MSESKEWLDLVQEALRLAKKNISYKEYELHSKIARSELGKSYFDRINVLNHLEKEGLIIVENGNLIINTKEIPEWLNNGLINGNAKSWDILESIDFDGKLAQKFDSQALEAIGLDGEKTVLNALRDKFDDELFKRVRHVSQVDDSLGYDISTPSYIYQEKIYLYEVKTSSRADDFFHFFISRNEANVAKKNNNWYLIAVIKENGKYKILGHLRFDVIEPLLPSDNSDDARWESAKVNIPKHLFIKNLP